jgi:Skp family chaperone for outer membrane proteins
MDINIAQVNIISFFLSFLLIFSLLLHRTIQTAQYINHSKLTLRSLDEIDAGNCDGLTYEEIAEKYPEEFSARAANKLKYRYPQGESYLVRKEGERKKERTNERTNERTKERTNERKKERKKAQFFHSFIYYFRSGCDGSFGTCFI